MRCVTGTDLASRPRMRLRSMLRFISSSALIAAPLLTGCASADEDAAIASSTDALTAATSGRALCAPSPQPSDGCTTKKAEYLLPHIAVFRDVFQDQCIRHDQCYGALGASMDECDDAFVREMKDRCNDKFNKYWRPVEWSACRSAAEDFYLAVRTAGVDAEFAEMQADAKNRSLWARHYVSSESCGTTPERSQIYHPRLIEEVRAEFRAALGRNPTTFEFFDAVNLSDPDPTDAVTDPRVWLPGMIRAYAATRPSTAPVASYSRAATWNIELTASPADAASYYWRVGAYSETAPTMIIPRGQSMYDRRYTLEGFLVVRDAVGNRDLALVSEFVYEPGECSSRRGLPCR